MRNSWLHNFQLERGSFLQASSRRNFSLAAALVVGTGQKFVESVEQQDVIAVADLKSLAEVTWDVVDLMRPEAPDARLVVGL